MGNKERKIATRDSWNKLERFPGATSTLSLNREFTEDEFEQLSRGLIPMGMDEKWFIFMEDDTLYFHRSWTGKCIYKVKFEKKGDKYVSSEILVNRDPVQYKETRDHYDERLLLFLIENLLLGNRTPFPVPSDISKAWSPKGAYQHSVAGTGFPEIEVETK